MGVSQKLVQLSRPLIGGILKEWCPVFYISDFLFKCQDIVILTPLSEMRTSIDSLRCPS